MGLVSVACAAPALAVDQAEINWDTDGNFRVDAEAPAWDGSVELSARRGDCLTVTGAPCTTAAYYSSSSKPWSFTPAPDGDWVTFFESPDAIPGTFPDPVDYEWGEIWVSESVRYPTGDGDVYPECVGHRDYEVWCDMSSVGGSSPFEIFPIFNNDSFAFSADQECVGRPGLRLHDQLWVENSVIVGSGYPEDMWPAGYSGNKINSCGGGDVLRLEGNDNDVDAGDGDDEIHGRKFSNLDGGEGKDYIEVGHESRAEGGGGRDTLVDHSGDSWLFGGIGNDLLYSQSGNDRLYGEAGEDRLQSGRERDRLNCGADRDESVAWRNSIVRGCEVKTWR